MEIQKISTSLLECVRKDDVVGARSLLAGVDEQDRKSVVAKRNHRDAPLFEAVMRGNVDMVEFLVKECKADTEELGRYEDKDLKSYHLVTPLWSAVASNKLEVVSILIDLGANINTASDTGCTPVLQACFVNEVIVEYLVVHGADVNKPDNNGQTCLMIAAMWNKEICQILIDNGVEVNAQNSTGDTALHFAINNINYLNKEDIVQLLIDNGSDPNKTNNDGCDVFQKASLGGQESILKKLVFQFEPPVKRKIELYELLGAVIAHKRLLDIEKVLPHWKNAVEMRSIDSCFDVDASQPNPLFLFARGVNTVEELETLSQNHDFLRMHALRIFERILGPHHFLTQTRLLYEARRSKVSGEIRRCIEISRYAYQLQNTPVEQLASLSLRRWYIFSLYNLCWSFCDAHSRNNCRIKFEEVV